MTMPEGVEVKLSAEVIRPLVTGHTIVTVDFPNTSRYHTEVPEGLTEFLRVNGESRYPVAQIQNVKTKGKFMYWEFKDEWYMFCTFGMTGQWSPKEGNHVSMHLSLVDNGTGKLSDIYFNDPRHFGTIKFVQGTAALRKKLTELGWDPLTQKLDNHWIPLVNKIRGSNKPIGQLLMDQKVFAGVGNYIRAEALYQAEISPWRMGNMMTKESIETLCKALVNVMEESYKHQGATIHTYTTVYGEEGKYSSCFKVYGQKSDPLGNPIIKEETPEGRTIHWCPMIQK
jgi:formamidopyrimidine-DNA glycosylase